MTTTKLCALIAACLATLGLTMFGSASASPIYDGASTTAAAPAPGYSITGTWKVTVDLQPNASGDQPPFESILSFDKARTVSETTSRAPSSAGLGAWQRTGESTFRFIVEKYRFDSTGAYAGKTVITERVELTGPDSYVGSADVKVLTPGNVVVAQFGSESAGVRMTP